MHFYPCAPELSWGLLKVPPEGVRGVTGESEGWFSPSDMAGSHRVDVRNECLDPGGLCNWRGGGEIVNRIEKIDFRIKEMSE